MILDAGPLALALLAAAAAGAGVYAAWRRLVRRARRDPAQAGESGRDALTGLPQQADFEEELRAAVHRAEDEGGAFTVLCIGLDAFDLLNAAYGRNAGDHVLRAIAQRIVEMRHEGLPIARLGGTEFGLTVAGDIAQGRLAAQALLNHFAQPLDVGTQSIRVSCSIGLANYPRHGARPRLVGQATMAMRVAREGGGGSHAEYEPRMEADQREQAELARDLRSALDRGELMLYYQPKVDARSLQITAAEALLRWQHPTRGIVSPTVFVPIAERHGLIGSIGNWVLEEATRQAAEWRASGLRMRVAINVSAYQMRQDDFTKRLATLLAQHHLRPERFTCEITETVAMEDTQTTQRAFERLGQLGVHVSIDDFGTGHSSLALLRRLPAAELKIDRAFVTDLGRSADALAVAKAVVQLAHTLDLRVVAEGVETELQRDHLLALGCDELQGFLFAKPMSAKALALWATNETGYAHPTFRASLFGDTETTPAGL
jgi:diguanylate cyclase (GGDEF)-like protein